jgi:hypothetical protein
MARGGRRTGAGRPKTVYRVELTPEEAHILDQYRQVYNTWLVDKKYPEMTTAEYLQATVTQQLRQRTFDPHYTPPLDQEREVLP